MADIERVSVEEARRRTKPGSSSLLVCAYDDEEKCNKIKLEGAISLAELRAKMASVPKDRELIFYCG